MLELIAPPGHTTAVVISLSYWNIVVTMLLPAAVALVNTRFAPGHIKALTLLFLSVVGGLINQVIAQGGAFEVKQSLWYVAITFAGAVLTHFGLLKPLAVTGASGAIAKNLPGGIGPEGTDRTPQVAPVGRAYPSQDSPPPAAPPGYGI